MALRIAFLGTGDFGVPALKAIQAAGHSLVVAISQPDRPAGRGLKLQPSAIHAAADELGVPHVQTGDVNLLANDELRGAEIGVVIAFGQKLGPVLLRTLPRGFINLHASLLPAFRGAAPFQWAILSGAETTGVTVFQLNEKWDAGAILAQRETPISESETAEELHDRLAVLGAPLLVETLAAIERGEAKPIEQNSKSATRAPKLSKADSGVDWSLSARAVAHRIHGLWSWPAANVNLQTADQTERVQLARVAVVDESESPNEQFPPGALRPDLTVQTGQGRVRILSIKPAGRNLMPFADYARGRRLKPPARFSAVEPG